MNPSMKTQVDEKSGSCSLISKLDVANCKPQVRLHGCQACKTQVVMCMAGDDDTPLLRFKLSVPYYPISTLLLSATEFDIVDGLFELVGPGLVRQNMLLHKLTRGRLHQLTLGRSKLMVTRG